MARPATTNARGRPEPPVAIRQAHQAAAQLEEQVRRAIPGVVRIVVHAEPVRLRDHG